MPKKSPKKPPSKPPRQAATDEPEPEKKPQKVEPPSRSKAASDAVMKAVQKAFGASSIGRLGSEYEEVRGALPTGLANLDKAIGVGGLPHGTVIELYGPESVGKTTTCKYLAGVAQRAGWVTLYIDREASISLDKVFDTRIGLDAAQLLLSKMPEVDTLEQCLTVVETGVESLLKSNAPGVIFFDSLAAAPMRDEQEKSLEESPMPGRRAYLLGRHLPRVLSKIQGRPIILIYVNQEREKIGALAFQEKTYSPGGRAFRHYAHLRLKVSAWGQVKQGDNVIGQKVRIKVRKSKVGPPLKEAELILRYVGELVDDPTNV